MTNNLNNEDFLHFIWKQKLYNQNDLRTTDNQQLEIINPGEVNHDAGPDFFNAKIKINGILWAGNIEVHHDVNDWKLHNHHKDKAYDNVILHVVARGNGQTHRTNGEEIPVLLLTWSDKLWYSYLALRNQSDWLACSGKLADVNSFEWSFWKERMLVERLESRSMQIKEVLKATTSNWDETFYRILFRSFGFGVNSEPFELLARSIPLTVLLKYSDNVKIIEALLYGQAGFLNEAFYDDYLKDLKREYHFIRQKHQLCPLEKHIWKFLRLRPSNFPTIRISQLAHLIVKVKGLFGAFVNEENLDVILDLLDVDVSEYWEMHYLPDRKSEKIFKNLGISSKNLIIINTIIPYLFSYGKNTQNHVFEDRAMDWLNLLKPEKNAIISKWKANEILVKNAGDSQALIYLSNNYCKKKKCLHCNIGHKVLTIKAK